ncbi:MAG: metalloregulator ArsR/SmtB family transcription factor [Halothiobacillaceae bacterium]
MEIESHSFFHALSDPTRIRCLALLHAKGELCVCDLVRALGLSQPKISRHLALLRDLGIVKARREGVWMHYQIHPELADWMRAILCIALEVYAASPAGRADLTALGAKAPSCLLKAG